MLDKEAGAGAFRRLGKKLLKTMHTHKKKMEKFVNTPAVQGAIGLGAVLGAAAGTEAGITAGVNKVMKKKHFNKAVNFDPEVSRWYKSEPDAVEARFNTLYRFNNMAAKDPLVASSWIKQTMEFPAVTPKVVTEIMTDKKKMPGGQLKSLEIGKSLSKSFSKPLKQSYED